MTHSFVLKEYSLSIILAKCFIFIKLDKDLIGMASCTLIHIMRKLFHKHIKVMFTYPSSMLEQ